MSSPERSRSDYAWIFAKGMGMGAADVVPGRSRACTTAEVEEGSEEQVDMETQARRKG